MNTQCSGGEHCVTPVQAAIFKVQADVFVRCLILHTEQKLACVASVSNRVIARKLERKQKKG